MHSIITVLQYPAKLTGKNLQWRPLVKLKVEVSNIITKGFYGKCFTVNGLLILKFPCECSFPSVFSLFTFDASFMIMIQAPSALQKIHRALKQITA